MFQRLAAVIMVSALLVFGIACSRLDEPVPGEQSLALQKLILPDSIPAKWGKLISVCSVPGIDKWAQLWLQDEEGVIRIIPYNVEDNYLSSQARVIRRD